MIFPFYEGNTQFSGIGFNVLRSHLRVIGNLPSSIRFQLHERTKTREALSLCKTCHLIISPSDKATHQCVPTCRGCLQPLAAEGKDNDGRCTKKRCIHRYTTESVCPRCPDGSNLHDPVACPLIQSTKSIDMEEFFSSLESTNYPPNQGRSPSYSEVASGRSQQQRTAADSSKSRIAAVPTPTTPPAAPFNAEAILTPPILLAIGKMIRQAIDESNLHGRIAKLEEAVAVISSSRATQQQRPPSPTQRYDRSPSPYHGRAPHHHGRDETRMDENLDGHSGDHELTKRRRIQEEIERRSRSYHRSPRAQPLYQQNNNHPITQHRQLPLPPSLNDYHDHSNQRW